jgi:cell division protein FtsI/penicillin-binding protein 2
MDVRTGEIISMVSLPDFDQWRPQVRWREISRQPAV